MRTVITVNGEPVPWQPGTTVATLLEQRGLDASRVAVELNGSVAARKDFAVLPVPDGARVEIVHFVGGG